MATVAAAAMARARREVQHHFFSQDAVRPDRAVPFQPVRNIDRRMFQGMLNRGIIREARPGTYWLDVVAFDIDLSGRYHRVKIALAVALLAFAIALVIPLLRH